MALRTDADLGTILAVFAHPDDEAYLAGGLMAIARDEGRRVVCVTATKGELGFPDDDPRTPAERAAVREAELAACLGVLGVNEHHWLDYPDGGCAGADQRPAVERLCELLEEVRPDTVLAFGPEGQTLHPDHIATSRWTTLAVRAAQPSVELLYAVMTPEWIADISRHIDPSAVMMVPGAEPPTTPVDELALWHVLDDVVLERKVAALRCQESQTAGFIATIGAEAYLAMNRDETFRHAGPTDWSR